MPRSSSRANRDISGGDLSEQLVAAAIEAGIDPSRFGLSFGQFGLTVTVADKRTIERRRTIVGRFDRGGPVVVYAEPVTGSGKRGRYRRDDRDLLAAVARPLHLSVTDGRSGRRPGTPAPNRVPDDTRRAIAVAMNDAVAQYKRRGIRGAREQAADDVAAMYGVMPSTALGIWGAHRHASRVEFNAAGD